CVDFSLANTSASSYRFGLSFVADLVDTGPTAYIASVSSTVVVNDGTQITINGAGFDSRGTPTVTIGGNTVPTLDSDHPSSIKFTPDSYMVGWSGTLKVITGDGNKLTGPYMHGPTMMQSGIAIPVGVNLSNARLFYRTGTSSFSVDTNGCPSSTGLEDSE